MLVAEYAKSSDEPEGWWITEPDEPYILTYENPSYKLRFATKQDCELAIKSMFEHGIYTLNDALEKLPTDDILAQVALKYLRW